MQYLQNIAKFHIEQINKTAKNRRSNCSILLYLPVFSTFVSIISIFQFQNQFINLDAGPILPTLLVIIIPTALTGTMWSQTWNSMHVPQMRFSSLPISHPTHCIVTISLTSICLNISSCQNTTKKLNDFQILPKMANIIGIKSRKDSTL